MDLHAELERVMADSAVADTAARAIRKLIDDAQKSAAEQMTRRDIELHAAKTQIQALTLELAHSTLAEWMGRLGAALQPLADRLTAHLLERSVLHADETPVQQLDPGNGKTKRAHLWAYMSNVL